MHHWQGPSGTHFNFNSDLSGDVLVATDEKLHVKVPAADLLALADHVRREHTKEQVDQGARFWSEVDRDVDKDRERREFIRRAAVALYAAMAPSQGFDRQVMGSHEAKDAWNMAEKLWGAKPEDA